MGGRELILMASLSLCLSRYLPPPLPSVPCLPLHRSSIAEFINATVHEVLTPKSRFRKTKGSFNTANCEGQALIFLGIDSQTDRSRDSCAACAEFRRYRRKTRTQEEPLFPESHYTVQNDDLSLSLALSLSLSLPTS